MKIRVTLKDPDAMHDEVDCALNQQQRPKGVMESEWQEMKEQRAEAIKASISRRWMEHGEYLSVDFEIDEHLKAVSATVVPN